MSRSHWRWMILALVSVFFIALPNFRYPIYRDQAIFLLIAQGLARGQKLYRDLWDTDPLGIFWMYIPIVKVFPKEQGNLAASPKEQATLESLHSRLVSLVSDATGPWRGRPYLQALDKAEGSSHVNLFYPQPIDPRAADTPFRIGIAQAYFKSQESAPTRPSRSEKDVLQSLPYQ